MPARIDPPTRAEMARLIETRMSQRELAEHYGVSGWTIHNWLKRFNLHSCAVMGPPKIHVDMERFAALVNSGMNKQQIADELGRSIDLVERLLKESGLKTRRQKQLTGGRRRRVVPSEKALRFSDPFGLAHGSFLSAVNR